MAKTKRFPRKQASDVSVDRMGIATGLPVTIALVVIFSALAFSGQAADKQSAPIDPEAIQADSQGRAASPLPLSFENIGLAGTRELGARRRSPRRCVAPRDWRILRLHSKGCT